MSILSFFTFLGHRKDVGSKVTAFQPYIHCRVQVWQAGTQNGSLGESQIKALQESSSLLFIFK